MKCFSHVFIYNSVVYTSQVVRFWNGVSNIQILYIAIMTLPIDKHGPCWQICTSEMSGDNLYKTTVEIGKGSMFLRSHSSRSSTSELCFSAIYGRLDYWISNSFNQLIAITYSLDNYYLSLFTQRARLWKICNSFLCFFLCLFWLICVRQSTINITPDLTFLNIHNPFTNERISVYLDKHSRMFLDTKDYFVKETTCSHLSTGVVIEASA